MPLPTLTVTLPPSNHRHNRKPAFSRPAPTVYAPSSSRTHHPSLKADTARISHSFKTKPQVANGTFGPITGPNGIGKCSFKYWSETGYTLAYCPPKYAVELHQPGPPTGKGSACLGGDDLVKYPGEYGAKFGGIGDHRTRKVTEKEVRNPKKEAKKQWSSGYGPSQK